MQKALLVALVATVDATFTFTADDIESEEALWELFGRWAAYHEVVREPGRFAAFKANVQWRWSKQRHSGRPMALNVFGDRSFDELAPQSCLKCAADPCPPDQEREVIGRQASRCQSRHHAPQRAGLEQGGNPTAVTDVKR